MNCVRTRYERGQTLLLMLMVLAMGSTWYLVSRLNNETVTAAALRKERDAQVLNRAKQALIGYIAAQALNSGEDNPGALPCPEAAGYFDNPSQEGQTAASCTLPKVGRFPWRTIGTEKLLDSAGEPLWYVVSPGWAVTSAGANTTINSNSVGQLTVDGAANAAVALIIAPGPAFSVPACGANAAISQTRPTTGTPDWRNYLECENATFPAPDATFVTSGPSGSFNDQVVRVTVAELMPALEAAIAKRVERDIVPQLKTVFAGPSWGLPAGSRMYPFAAPFGPAFPNPGPGAGTSTYAGVYGTYAGLLPFNQVNCTADANNPRCLPGSALISWLTFSPAPTAYDAGNWGYIQSQSCWWESGNAARVCEGEYHESDLNPGVFPYTDTSVPGNLGMRIEMQVALRNVAMGLRRFDTTRMQIDARNDGSASWISQPVSYAVSLNSWDGSATITFWADLPNIDKMGWGTWAQYRIRIERLVVNDHALLDTTAATIGWFARNEWFRLAYYAVAQGHTVTTLPPSCTTGTNCLTVANVSPTGAQRAILILTGASVNGSARPSTTLANYLESGNATGAFTRMTVRAGTVVPLAQRFNDRVLVVDTN